MTVIMMKRRDKSTGHIVHYYWHERKWRRLGEICRMVGLGSPSTLKQRLDNGEPPEQAFTGPRVKRTKPFRSKKWGFQA